jgi:hypothetical protein
VLRDVFQSRVFVALALGIIALGDIALCALFGRTPHAWFAVTTVLVICLGFGFIHLRHAALALATALAPLPGLIAAVSLAHGAALETLALAYLAGLTIALFLADEIALRVVEGSGVADATAGTLQDTGIAACAAIIAASAFTALLFFAGLFARVPAIGALAEFAAGASALIVLPLVASLLPFGEDFVARANRLRELRERRIEKIVAVTEPRWGWSLTGIGIVFLAPAFFGSRSLHLTASAAHSALEILLAAAVVAVGAALVATRDWRRSLAVAIVLGLVALIGCWGYARGGVTLDIATWLLLMQALGVGVASILLVANAARPDVGEDTTAASVRSLLGKTSAAVTSSICAVVVLLVFSFGIGGEAIALAVAIFFAGVGAVLLQPALTIAIETLVPRRSTIEARYRVN